MKVRNLRWYIVTLVAIKITSCKQAACEGPDGVSHVGPVESGLGDPQIIGFKL